MSNCCVAVREHVLTKAFKLYGAELATLRTRFRLARLAHRTERLQTWLQEALRDPDGIGCLRISMGSSSLS